MYQKKVFIEASLILHIELLNPKFKPSSISFTKIHIFRFLSFNFLKFFNSPLFCFNSFWLLILDSPKTFSPIYRLSPLFSQSSREKSFLFLVNLVGLHPTSFFKLFFSNLTFNLPANPYTSLSWTLLFKKTKGWQVHVSKNFSSSSTELSPVNPSAKCLE